MLGMLFFSVIINHVYSFIISPDRPDFFTVLRIEKCPTESLVILTSWFSRSIHRHFHTLGVESKDGRRAGDEDGQVEALAPATATDEAKIVELGDVVLHDCGVVPQLATEVLIVAGSQGDHSPVIDLTQRNHLGKNNM